MGEIGNSLQLLERTTAECYVEAHARRDHVRRRVTDKFEQCVRLTALDGALSNPRGERQIMLANRGDNFESIGLTCEIHTLAGDMRKTFRLVQWLLRGQLHMALAINDNVGRLLFRQQVHQVVLEWGNVCYG